MPYFSNCIRLTVTVSFCIILTTVSLHGQIPTKLAREFRDPPVPARPKALWPWVNGNFSLSQITYELEEAKRKGMGGFDIWDVGTNINSNKVMPDGPSFLGSESLQGIAHAIREADRLGLEIGLTLSSSWNAGGSWVKPEHGAMGLFKTDTIVKGPMQFATALPFPVIPEKYGSSTTLLQKDQKTGLPVYYKEVGLLAHPYAIDSAISISQVVDLHNKVDGTGMITWQVPPGIWRIIRYVCTPTGQPLAIPSPNSKGLMLDHFSAEAQRSNLQYIFNSLIPVTGSLKNRSLQYLYADSYEVNSAVWTPLLPEEFQKRNGYSLISYLPILDGFKTENGNIHDRFLFDFTKTLSDLIIDNHYRLGRKICEEHGIGFCAEAGGPGQPIHNVPFEDLKALGSLTIPRGEFWNGHPQWELLQIIKGIASASHIYNQKFVEAESFTSVWLWQEGPAELKPLADRAMCEGLNRFVYHTFPHTPPESGFPGWIYNFGTVINTTNGWWPKSRGFHDYLARCSYLLQQGNFRGDVAFYYGDRAPNFVPLKHIIAGLGQGYDYDVINTEVLLEKMAVRNGRFWLPHGQYYEVLVLPDERIINPKVLQKLEKLVAAGGTVIGPKPRRSYSLQHYESNDMLIESLANKLWGNCDSIHIKEHRYGKGKIIWGKSMREVLMQKGIIPDLQVFDNNDSLDFIHRSTGKEEIYFIRNIRDKPLTLPVHFRIKDLQPELWNPVTGTILPVTIYSQTKEGIVLPLALGGYGSCFIVFRNRSGQPATELVFNNKNVIQETADKEIFLQTKNGIAAIANGEWKWKLNGTIHSKVISLPEALKLGGPWKLVFEQRSKNIPGYTLDKLIPLNESAEDDIRYYSGTIAYHHHFNMEKGRIKKDHRLLLDLGKVREIAEVYLNGHKLGLLWHAPFLMDITDAVQPGENYLIIEVVNTINNMLIGDGKLSPQYRRAKSNITKLPNAWSKPFEDAPLLPAGLIGPVTIHYAEKLY